MSVDEHRHNKARSTATDLIVRKEREVIQRCLAYYSYCTNKTNVRLFVFLCIRVCLSLFYLYTLAFLSTQSSRRIFKTCVFAHQLYMYMSVIGEEKKRERTFVVREIKRAKNDCSTTPLRACTNICRKASYTYAMTIATL